MAVLISSVTVGPELPEDTTEIKTLTVEQATALTQRPPPLYLDGPAELPDEVAKALAQHSGGNLSLDEPATVTVGAPAELSHTEGELSLHGAATLSEDAAQPLAQHSGGLLALNGLTTPADEAAKALSQHDGELFLQNLTKTLWRTGGCDAKKPSHSFALRRCSNTTNFVRAVA